MSFRTPSLLLEGGGVPNSVRQRARRPARSATDLRGSTISNPTGSEPKIRFRNVARLGALGFEVVDFRRNHVHPGTRNRDPTGAGPDRGGRISPQDLADKSPRAAVPPSGATPRTRAARAARLYCRKSPPRYRQNSRPSPFQGAGVRRFGPSQPGAAEARKAPSRRSRVRRGFRHLWRRVPKYISWCPIARAMNSSSPSQRIVVSSARFASE